MSRAGKPSIFRPAITHTVVPVHGIPPNARTSSLDTGGESEDDASTNVRKETVLFCIDKSNNCLIGLPPAAEGDNYHQRAMELGTLTNISHVFFNPKGEMFAVRGHELFKGPTPSSRWNDWFQLAKCVGRGDWDKFKFISFSPGGILYVITKAGAFYKGPEPTNRHISWLYKQATLLGGRDWQYFDVMCFDPEGIMYVVWRGELRKNPPVTNILGEWLNQSVNVGKSGWGNFTHFMGFSYEGELWCVSNNDGMMWAAPPPTHKNDPWVTRAKKMGKDYRKYRHMKFTQDKTIQKILGLNFLVDSGKILDTIPEIVTLQDYDNKDSTSPLQSTFEVDKTCIAETQFSHEHGFAIGFEAETTFKAKVPFVGEGGYTITASSSTSHTWNFTDINRIETHYKMSTAFVIPAGKAVRLKAVVKKANIDVPYTAEVMTVFGYKTTISGIWKGASFFNLSIRQEDL